MMGIGGGDRERGEKRKFRERKKRGDWGKLIMANHLFALRVLYVDRSETANSI